MQDLEAMSQILTVLSSLPDTTRRVSGLNLQDRTQWACPVREYWNFLSATFQILMVLSSALDSKWMPCFEKLTLLTGPEWPLMI